MLRKPEEGHDYGVDRCPFHDEGDALMILDDGRVLVRWRISGRYNAERVDSLILWETPR